MKWGRDTQGIKNTGTVLFLKLLILVFFIFWVGTRYILLYI